MMKLQSLKCHCRHFVLATIGTASAQAPTWKPSGPVSVIVHTGPGGGTDAFGRAIITALDNDKILQNNFVIVNKTGGGSTSAMNYLQEKTGDPNTIAIFSSVWVTDGLVQAEAKITIQDLTPIARSGPRARAFRRPRGLALQDPEGLYRRGESVARQR